MTPDEKRQFEDLQRTVNEMKQKMDLVFLQDRYLMYRDLEMFNGKNIRFGKSIGTMIGTETTQKLAFFGDTPIVQQTTSSQTPATFSANSSGIANDTATWNGYTIGDIVAILQAFGLIA